MQRGYVKLKLCVVEKLYGTLLYITVQYYKHCSCKAFSCVKEEDMLPCIVW